MSYLRERGNAELLDEYADRHDDSWPAARAELLRRLSAGNPQAEKVQITNAGCPCGCGKNVHAGSYRTGYAYDDHTQPKRSDGRIQDESPMSAMVARIYELTRLVDAEYVTGDEIEVTLGGGHLHMRVGPKAGGRYRYYGALLVERVDEYVRLLDQRPDLLAAAMEAQRSVGRIEAGSVVFKMESSFAVKYEDYAMISHGMDGANGYSHAKSLAPTCKLCQEARGTPVERAESGESHGELA